MQDAAVQTTRCNLFNKPKTEMSTKPIESHLKEILRREYQRRQPGMIKVIEDWLERGKTPQGPDCVGGRRDAAR